MLLRDWVEALTIHASKDQHKHTLAFRFNSVSQSIARDHMWSWLERIFYFKQVNTFTSTDSWLGGAGSTKFTTVALHAGDIGRRWTGAEIIVTGSDLAGNTVKPQHYRIVGVGSRGNSSGSYDTAFIEVDKPIPESIIADPAKLSFGKGFIRVFRREYVPRTSPLWNDVNAPGVSGPTGRGPDVLIAEDYGWGSDRFLGEIRLRDRNSWVGGSTTPRLQVLSKHDSQVKWGYDQLEAGPQQGRFVTIGPLREIPVPRRAPIVPGTNAIGIANRVNGTYYLAFAYRDRDSGIVSPLGPVTAYIVSGGATPLNLEVEYGNVTGKPDETYELILCITVADPKGLDQKAVKKGTRISSRMLPFYIVGVHPHDNTTFGAGTLGGGRFTDVAVDQFITDKPRYWPSSDYQMITLQYMPDQDTVFAVDGKVRMPWFTDEFDKPLVPDSFLEMVTMGMLAGVSGSSGTEDISKRTQFEFLMRKLKGSDIKRSGSSAENPRHYGSTARIDRYNLNETVE